MNKTRKNAFTLIELLAVIVVLAILALIAVPIVLNIIKDARNNSNKRSIESYARAIDYAVSEYMSENPDVEVVTWEDIKDKVEYKGKVECQWGENLSTISQAGEITLHGCKVNNKTNSIYGYEKGKVTEEKEIVYKEYNVGDEITYKGMKFYVIAPSDTKQDYVTLLKAEPLTVEEVNTYGEGHINRNTWLSLGKVTNEKGYGGMAYYTSSNCGCPSGNCGYPTGSNFVTTGCTTDYNTSEIKYVVDTWSNAKLTQGDLEDINGYSARLITFDELITNLGYEFSFDGSIDRWHSTVETPSWVYGNYLYWTMSPYQDSTSAVWMVDLNVNAQGNLFGYIVSGTIATGAPGVVRPVINLKKSAIQ